MTETPKEPTELEQLEADIAEKQDQRRALKELERQRTILLPQLKKRQLALGRKIKPLKDQLKAVETAIIAIESDQLTPLRLRKPRKKKATGDSEAPAT